MSWENNVSCQSCKTTIYNYRAKGYCTKCYRIDEAIKKLNELSNDQLALKIQLINRPGTFFDRNRDQMIELLASYEKAKLKNLILYGKIQNGEKGISILELEDVFNQLSRRSKSKVSYIGRLDYIQLNFNRQQKNKMALLLLRMIV